MKKEKVKNSSPLLFSSVHLLLVGQKKRGERSFMVRLRVPRSILFTKKKTVSSTHRERLLVYYHSHNIPKTLFFFSLGKIKIYPARENWCQEEKRRFPFFYFREGGFEPSYTRRGDLTPKKKKKKEISMIGYAAHVPNSGGGGCWGSISSVVKKIKIRISPNEEERRENENRPVFSFFFQINSRLQLLTAIRQTQKYIEPDEGENSRSLLTRV